MQKFDIFSRLHDIGEHRFPQIHLNQLAVEGGRDYVEARLWRAPNESDLSWRGRSSLNPAGHGPGLTGRIQRAALVADAQRIAHKINDYIFGEDAVRDGADPAFVENVDGTGTPIRQFFETTSTAVTTAGWCWLQADRGRVTGERNLADRLSDTADRPYWTLWPATSVPDWHFDDDGMLGWLITQGTVYDNADPYAPAVTRLTRTLWQRDPAGCYWRTWHEGNREPVDEGRLSVPDLPFVLVGNPDPGAWWMDNVEALQAQLLNLDSLHAENLVRAVYPQLVIPASMLEGVEARLLERFGNEGGARTVEAVREIVRGLDSPFVERSDDSGITRFLTPSAADLNAIPTEIMRKRGMLFENVGLSRFFSESRQIMSAEGQRLGLQDINSTLRNRVLLLEEAENELVGVTAALDTGFQSYVAEWNKTFDIHDPETEAKVVQALNSVLKDPEADSDVTAKAREILAAL